MNVERSLPLPHSPFAIRNSAFAILLVLLALAPAARSDTSWFDRLDDSLFLSTRDGTFRTDLSVLADLELYSTGRRPPGLLFGNDPQSINPRLSLFLDTRLGNHLYSLVQVRWDRGFDPFAKPDGTARFDEYLLRYTPFTEPWLNIKPVNSRRSSANGSTAMTLGTIPSSTPPFLRKCLHHH